MSNKNIVITGRVIEGEGLGHKMGYPTANLTPRLISDLDLNPGIYAAWGRIADGQPVPAVVIVGARHKFISTMIKLEIYFIDFNQDILGKEISAEIVKKIRPMQDFKNLPGLIKRIELDIAETKKILNNS
ncbi:riboflavin kinase [Patescibacteria group bacterium]